MFNCKIWEKAEKYFGQLFRFSIGILNILQGGGGGGAPPVYYTSVVDLNSATGCMAETLVKF